MATRIPKRGSTRTVVMTETREPEESDVVEVDEEDTQDEDEPDEEEESAGDDVTTEESSGVHGQHWEPVRQPESVLVNYRPHGSQPRNAILLDPDEPVRYEGIETPTGVRLSKAVYRRTVIPGTMRYTFTLVRPAGAIIPRTKVQKLVDVNSAR